MKIRRPFTYIILINIFFCYAASVKILGIFPMFGYSQFLLGDKLMSELAKRGHDVTIISPFKPRETIQNYRHVSNSEFIEVPDDDVFLMQSMGTLANLMFVTQMCLALTEWTLKATEVQNLLKSNATFDLVISEQFYNEAHMGFASHYGAKLLLFSSLAPYESTDDLVGYPVPYSYVPSLFTGFTQNMNFWQRLANSFVYVFYKIYHNLFILPKQSQLLRKYFPESPDLSELMYNGSLFLFNSHASTHIAAPSVPNMIEIGGFHVDPKPLPKDLQEYLDEAKEGVVYFSMGSVLVGKDLPGHKRDAILKAFSKLKQKVLWKWEDDVLPNKPANVKISKWTPQQDVLAHPNVKAFISHCGLLSTIESTYHGVPVIGIPIFGDQNMNMALGESFGSTYNLPFLEITEESMTKALNEVLYNPKYKEKARLKSKLLRDQPIKPLEKAIYWIEYVLRYDGTEHLRVKGLQLTWYQYYLLDIAAFIFVTIFGLLMISYRIISSLIFKKKIIRSTPKRKIN